MMSLSPTGMGAAFSSKRFGFDLAKRVFQVHGGDAGGPVVMRRKLQRGEVAAFSADRR